MVVTRIGEHQSRETVGVLEELLARATRGEITALAFAIKTGPRKHRIGITGEYWRDPVQVLGVVTRLEYRVNHIISGRDDEQQTETMPL